MRMTRWMWRSRTSQAKQLEAVLCDGEPSVYKKAVENDMLRFLATQEADGEGREHTRQTRGIHAIRTNAAHMALGKLKTTTTCKP